MPHTDQVLSKSHPAYFITCSVVRWMPIFTQPSYSRIMLDNLNYLRNHKQTQLNAFVIMPTLVRAVIWPEEGVSESDILRDFKRLTTRSISKEAVQQQDQYLLNIFAAVRESDRAEDGSQYQVWQEGSQAEAISTLKVAQQKIDYIHACPVQARLVNRPEEWPSSSARAYLYGERTYPAVDVLRP